MAWVEEAPFAAPVLDLDPASYAPESRSGLSSYGRGGACTQVAQRLQV